jgi:hypothetical protein
MQGPFAAVFEDRFGCIWEPETRRTGGLDANRRE